MSPETAKPEPERKTEPPAEAAAPFLIVGIGASAGGLEAFSQLLSALPRRPGMALLFVQHLQAETPSLLAEILSRYTDLPVAQAEEGEAVRMDHVYVLPPNRVMRFSGGKLELHPRTQVAGHFMPFDYLCRSLADELGNHAVGVVLSGTGTDGTLGLAAIKAQAGITLVQDDSAKFQQMPRSVVLDGHADFVLPPEGIAQQLARLVNSGAAEPDRPSDSPVDGDGLKTIFRLLRARTGVDFSHYKLSTVKRRIRRRMALHNIEDFDAYVQELEADPTAVQALYQDLLIRVTNFFRDPEAFEYLKRFVFPPLFKDREPKDPVRLWVAGCATGEEVYSVAITLLEYFGETAANTPVKILATDISESAIEKARQGTYIENIEMDVSPERLRRFFSKTNSHYQINKSIRDLCIFARHNLFSDPPFSRIDLITCRNVLIYLDQTLQRRVLPRFHYALRPGGLLMLGLSESVGTFADLFTPVDEKHHIYQRRSVPSGINLDMDLGHIDATLAGAAAESGRPRDVPTGVDIQREVDRLVLSKYAPAGVVVDEHMTILQFRGQTGPYLEPAPGTASLNLLHMLREGLSVEVRTVLAEARNKNLPARRTGLLVRDGSAARPINVEVLPVRVPLSGARYFVVLFEPAQEKPSAPPRPDAAEPPTSADQSVEALRQRVAQQQQELSAAHENLQALTEEYEATSEELKSANEEILSSNEELQSTNEELQTAKEEMQSANEELATLNEELQNRNTELGKVNDDLINLLGGVNIPIIMVGPDLRIRRFTPLADRLLNLIPNDVGRPLSDIRPNINVDNLEGMIREVIDTLQARELEVRDRDGCWYALRIRPYVTLDNKIEGATVVALDVNKLKQSMQEVQQSRDYAEAIIQTIWEPLIALDGELRVRRANRAFYLIFQTTAQEAAGHSIYELPWGPDHLPRLRAFLEGLPAQTPHGAELEADVELLGQGRRSLLLKAYRLPESIGSDHRILLAIQDITERKREMEHARQLASEQTARARAELANRMKDEFLAMLAHELRNPLTPIRNSLGSLRQQAGRLPGVPAVLDRIERQVKNMTRLLDDLFDVSRITQHKIQLNREPVDLCLLARQVLENVRVAAQARKLKLEVSLPEHPLLMDGDPVRLEQVLVNLLNNAVKYTPPGGEIRLTAEREDSTAVLRVADTGLGIAPEIMPTIFEPFVQGDRPRDRAQGGLGIGLTLVRSLAELHGGSVEARSDGPGKGSEFILRLPVLGSQPATEPPAEQFAAIPLGQGLRVLCVDDQRDIAESLAQLLQDVGYEARAVGGGEQALEQARQFAPHAVLLDLGLPDLDGFEVARRLRQDPATQDVLLIALSGFTSEEDRQKARAAGFDTYLVKPARAEDLFKILGRLHEKG